VVRAVFFDFGGTLFSYGDLRAEFDALLGELARGHGVERPPPELRRVYRSVMARVFLEFQSRPFYLHRELFERAQAAFLRALGSDPPAAGQRSLYERQSALGLSRVEARPEARETLHALRARGLHLSVVSNIDDDQFGPLWQQLGLAPLFHATTTSEEARSCKPDPGIFRLALRKAGGPAPEEVVFVGDSLAHDVAGAHALGMTTVLLAPEEPRQATPRPRHWIRDLRGLLEILET
jgi:putative hydrolase of the HAD superfamily